MINHNDSGDAHTTNKCYLICFPPAAQGPPADEVTDGVGHFIGSWETNESVTSLCWPFFLLLVHIARPFSTRGFVAQNPGTGILMHHSGKPGFW